MSSHDFDAGLLSPIFLKKLVVRLQVQHTGRLLRVDGGTFVDISENEPGNVCVRPIGNNHVQLFVNRLIKRIDVEERRPQSRFVAPNPETRRIVVRLLGFSFQQPPSFPLLFPVLCFLEFEGQVRFLAQKARPAERPVDWHVDVRSLVDDRVEVRRFARFGRGIPADGLDVKVLQDGGNDAVEQAFLREHAISRCALIIYNKNNRCN